MRPATMVLLFVLGATAGIAVDRAWFARPRANPMDSAVLLREMDRRLALDSAQHVAIARVLDRNQIAIDSTWRAARPAVQGAIDRAQMEIVRILRDDQRDRYLRWMRAAHSGALHDSSGVGGH